MNYIISDLHFNHALIICYENRPFKSVIEMNEALVKNWNQTVNKSDNVFVLGDVFFNTNKENAKNIMDQLNGKKILIMGNHDRHKSISWWRYVGFEEVYRYPIIYRDFFILSHEPVYIGPCTSYVNIHGHTHTECSNNHQKINVSVEATNYSPIELDCVVDAFLKSYDQE